MHAPDFRGHILNHSLGQGATLPVPLVEVHVELDERLRWRVDAVVKEQVVQRNWQRGTTARLPINHCMSDLGVEDSGELHPMAVPEEISIATAIMHNFQDLGI